MSFHPYLNFGGNCREAFTRYQEILGGELDILGMDDLPEADRPGPDAAGLTMHAALVIGDDMLLGSDDFEGNFPGVTGMWANLTLDSVDEAERVFAALAEGGEIAMPLDETFWSPRFGMCTDRFGIPWMVNTNPPTS